MKSYENMKTKYALITLATGLMMTLAACDDYLSDTPKGEKIPETYADFEALLRDEYSNHRIDATQPIVLLNDRYLTKSNLAYYIYWAANYNWDEQADRIQLNNKDEGAYYNAYAGISTFNLITERAAQLTECTEAQRQELEAQCRVLRAMNYFFLVNHYSDTYVAATAAEKGGVPLILSANVLAPYTQPSVEAIYTQILEDLDAAYPHLPQQSATVLHPDRATADAFYARLYLQMMQYDKALEYADKALSANDALYDWCAFYEQMAGIVNDPNNYTTLPAPNAYDYCENYNYRHAGNSYASTEYNLPIARAERFEEGDARFLTRWKYYNAGNEQYYRGVIRGQINYEGMTTVEIYLIKAECLARQGKVSEAMKVLNKVRQTRILPEAYQPLTATTEAEAMPLIIRTKQNEMIMTSVPFCDARRLNAEGKYPVTLTKQVEGVARTLSSSSHLWTFPIPLGAIGNSGNGTIHQNVAK